MPDQSTSQIDESHAPDAPEAVNCPVLRQRLPIAQGVPCILPPCRTSSAPGLSPPYIGEVVVGPTLHEGSDRVKTKAEIIRATLEAKVREL